MTPARYGVSSTLRGIYLIRYLLFSGGLASALGMLQRAALGAQPPVAGLLIGFFVGLLVFRGQLRPLRWPTLVLSQDAVYLVQRRQAVTLPWKSIRAVAADGPRVTLHLREALRSPTGETTEAIQLEARKFGVSPEKLLGALGGLLSDPLARLKLPPDQKVRASLQIP